MPRHKPKILLLLICVLAVAMAKSNELDNQIAKAKFEFDRERAEALLPELEDALTADAPEEAVLRYADAALLVAELRRGDYEKGELEKKERRELGKDIDKVAKSAIKALEKLPDSSERYRLNADLLAVMIRSKFRGMKYQPKLEKALDKALELDENNANAWVSLARRPLFAKPSQGGDTSQALEYLEKALAANPNHVQALLFRGAAHYKLGDETSAQVDWDRALSLNPNTAGARERLLKIDMSYEDDKT
jgi:tetratricopeptide (TPR) repeat protein